MTAIDFTQLLRDAKRKAKQPKVDTLLKTDDRASLKVENNEASRSEGTSANRLRSETNDGSSISDTHNTTNHLPTWDPSTESSLHFDKLELRQICSDPKSIYYSREALADSRPLWHWLESLPHGNSGLEEWKTMTYGKRKVCMFGESESGVLPPPLAHIAQNLVTTGIFSASQPPNHVLLNDYEASQGILPHTDGPRYASRTATLSLGSDVVLEFTKRLATDEIGIVKDDDNRHTILLKADSLIVFEDDAYLHYCHGITMDVPEDVTDAKCLNASPGVVVPRGRRFSLTFRHKLATDCDTI